MAEQEVDIPTSPSAFDVYEKLIDKRILFLKDEINAETATRLSANLLWLNCKDTESEITIYINSWGGTVSDGLFTIYDTMQYIEAPITTVVIGEAYSGAAVILAAGSQGRRFAYPSARIMIHAVQIDQMSGSSKEIEVEAKRIKELNTSLMKTIAQHTGQTLKKIQKDCEEDKFFCAKEALKYGLIDEIIKPAKKQ